MNDIRNVTLLDTSIGSANLGDSIIVEAVLAEFPELASATRLGTHNFWGLKNLRAAKRSQISLLTGTNALSSFVYPPTPWRLGPLEVFSLIKKVVIVGAGWRKYEQEISAFQQGVYRAILHPDLPISVRDCYSDLKFKRSGMDSIYTGCPTMWSLGPATSALSDEEDVVLTLTDYSRHPETDQFLLDNLALRFKRVHFWPQGFGDEEYLKSLSVPSNLRILPRSLLSLNESLLRASYVGTRLHAGVRAAQLQVPSLVIGIDNRAVEIGRDTNFPVLDRSKVFENLHSAIDSLSQKREIVMPHDSISNFKKIVTNKLCEIGGES